MNNIVICTDLNENSLETLKGLCFDSKNGVGPILNLSDSTLHFIHVFEVHIYNVDIVPIIFPTEAQYPEIEKSTLSILEKLASEIGIGQDKIKVQCFFSHSREEKINQYLRDVKASLAIVATRGKHGIEGLFSSSLADFLCKYSPCDVLVLRPKKNKK